MKQPPPQRHQRRYPQRGGALLGLVVVIAVLSAAQWWLQQRQAYERQRDREAQLLFVGDQYRRALNDYARWSPPGAPRFPKDLRELLDDRRSPVPRQHLRQLWPDPFTGTADWELIRAGDRIIGVHSRSTAVMLKRHSTQHAELPGKEPPRAPQARDWRFVASGIAAGLPMQLSLPTVR